MRNKESTTVSDRIHNGFVIAYSCVEFLHYAEARIEGREAVMTDGILASIRNLMKQTGWPLEKALTMLDIPENQSRFKYCAILRKMRYNEK